MSKSTFPKAPSQYDAGVVSDFFKPRSAAFQEVYDFEPSLTRQEFADDCDINTIMDRYQTTGLLPQRPGGEPSYGDYLNVPNLQEALHAMADAEASFMALPAKVRREFDNDPVQFVEFASDPDNLDQMRQWGLAPPAPPEAPTALPEISPAPAGPAVVPPLGEAPKPA